MIIYIAKRPDKVDKRRRGFQMGSIDYQKQMMEIVYINLPGPAEPTPGMTGGELLHGFLAELHETPNMELKAFISSLSSKWNVVYRYKKD